MSLSCWEQTGEQEKDDVPVQIGVLRKAPKHPRQDLQRGVKPNSLERVCLFRNFCYQTACHF